MGAMTVFFTKAFSPLHFKGDHFISFYLAYDLGLDSGLYLVSEGQFAIGIYQEDFSEFQFVAGIACYMRNVQGLVFGDLKLLSGYFYNCKHNYQY